VAGFAGSPGDSEGAGARLSSPGGITVDPNGAIYIADTGNHRVCIAHAESALSSDRRRSAKP